MKEKNIRISEQAKGGVEFALFLISVGLMYYGLEAVRDSQNNLSELKMNNLTTPQTSAQCDPAEPLDMGCWTQVTQEVCNGNNTLNRSDDVCETLEYWYYVPVVNYFR